MVKIILCEIYLLLLLFYLFLFLQTYEDPNLIKKEETFRRATSLAPSKSSSTRLYDSDSEVC